MIKLRPYQEKVKADIYSEWDKGKDNVLAVLPTGGGKSVILCTIAKEHGIDGNQRIPTAIVVHRKELVQQLSLTLCRMGIVHNLIAPQATIKQIISAQRRLHGKQFYHYGSPVTVVSVDTLNARANKHQDWCAKIKLWITDEAHHVLKDNKWGKALKLFNNAKGLGVTATPERLDKKGLGSHTDGVFDSMIKGPEIKWMIQQGYLCKWRAAVPESDYVKFLGEKKGNSDFTAKQMNEAANKSQIVGDVVDNYIRFAKGTQAILFSPTIDVAKRMEAEFLEKGINALTLSSFNTDKERLEGMLDFENKKIQVLLNVDLFDEGLDVPGIETVILARPTMSLGKYRQMCLDSETEILTNKGWQTLDTISYDQKAVGFSYNGELSETIIENIIKRPRAVGEDMYSVKSPHLDIRVTDKHDMVVKTKSSKGWSKEYAEDAAKRKTLHQLPVCGEFDLPDANIKDCELSLLGWLLSDGCISLKGNGKNQLSISQSLNHKSNIEHIEQTLKDCNVPYTRSRRRRTGKWVDYADSYEYVIGVDKPEREFKRWEGKDSLTHLIPWLDKTIPEIYDTLSVRQLKLLLHSLWLGDGFKFKNVDYTPHTRKITCGDNKQMADRLQSLIVTRGMRCNMSIEKREGKDLYHLYIKKVKYSTIAGQNDKDGSILGKKEYIRSRWKKESEYKDEMVWCITNPLGTIITRRNGKVVVMGNCGRGLRPAPGKDALLIIDHAGNLRRHLYPDAVREWTLDKIAKRKGQSMIKICENPECFAPYERFLSSCPWCGHEPKPKTSDGGGRIPPEEVDGDLLLIDPFTLDAMNKATILETPESVAERVMHAAGVPASIKAARNQQEKIDTQKELTEAIAYWAGEQKMNGLDDRAIHKMFYLKFGKTIAQSLAEAKADMTKTIEKLRG